MNLLYKITYGLFVLSAGKKENRSGCVINTLMQVTSTPERFIVAVNKQNYTHEIFMREKAGAVTFLSTLTTFDFIKGFGFRTGRGIDKFNEVQCVETKNGSFAPTENTLGYMDLRVLDTIDLGTHTEFICEATDKVAFVENREPLTYAYYQSNVKPKIPMAQSVTDEEEWLCTICNYIHKGPITDDIICPVCKHGREAFVKIEKQQKLIKQEDENMKKFVCMVCGYTHTGDSAPDQCPTCKAPKEKFKEQTAEDKVWAAEHRVGIVNGVSEDIIRDLRANFEGECQEVGMYLAMSRVAFREGYPEVGEYYRTAAWEEAEHASRFAEMLGEVVTSSTKKNLEMRVEAEFGATMGKTDLATRAKAANLDAIHDSVHEMARDEARHGKAFKGLLDRLF